MEEREFNLLTEPWIRVMREDCRVEELSLPDVLINAHRYKGLAGELPTQDAALLRLLLAVLHAVFERVDVNGAEYELETEDDALERWQQLWECKYFPAQPLQDYFEQQKENFWLFHPERPFWQTAKIPDGVKTQSEPVRKLNGAISESGHKVRLFAERSEGQKDELSNAEAARWLVCMNQYDDNTLKTGLGLAWLGGFSAIFANGKNLFETLMLNFVLLDQADEVWDIDPTEASWEKRWKEREDKHPIVFPHNQVAILSAHSRYGKLEREGGKITKYRSAKGGNYFDHVTYDEQMALWKHNPKTDDYNVLQLFNKQIWREFGTIIEGEKIKSRLVNWHQHLIMNQHLRDDLMLSYQVVSIEYDKSQKSSVDNIYSDSLQLHAGLLSDLGAIYRQLITDEIARCDKIAYYLGQLANDLFYAAGGDTEEKVQPSASAKEQYFYAIDVPFRKWLASLRVEDEATKRDAKILQWREDAEAIALRLAEQMAANAGPAAFVGKTVTQNNKKKYYSSSTALNWFKYNMHKLNNPQEVRS